MTFGDIETALGQRLDTLDPSYPIAWPNKDFDPKAAGNLPYIEFQHVPTLRSDESIDASLTVQTGIALMTVVTARDAFTGQANTIAQAVADLFSYGLRLSVTGGTVMIAKPADPVPGFTDGVYWRLPVRVNYRTTPAL